MRAHSRLPVAALLLLASSCQKPPHVVLTVTNHDGAAASATQLAVGLSAATLSATAYAPAAEGVTVAVTAPEAGEHSLYLEARAADGTALARAVAVVHFPEGGVTGTATVDLARVCFKDPDCDNRLFCAGEATCSGGDFGLCQRASPPCTSSFACVAIECLEDKRACATTVDHALCTPVPLPDGSLEATYCDPALGCVPGKACTLDADCADASTCNGAERCAGFHCEAGTPVNPDDSNPCTRDFCIEPQGEDHEPDHRLDGASCTLESDPGGKRICVSGDCVVSRCGDKFVDASLKETCDDGNSNPSDGCDKCRLTAWAPEVVTGLGRSGGKESLLELFAPIRPGFDGVGALYLPDHDGGRVWRIDLAAQQVTLAAGNGGAEPTGDGGLATATALDWPTGADLDTQGNLYVAEYFGKRIRRIDARTGLITTVAGGGTSLDDHVSALSADAGGPEDVAVDVSGNLYFVDSLRKLLRRVDARTGEIVTVAGAGPAAAGSEGAAYDILLDDPRAVATVGVDAVYVAERCRVRRITLARPDDPTSGTMVTLAGQSQCGCSGDGVAGREALFTTIQDLAVEPSGSVLIADGWGCGLLRQLTFDGAAGEGTLRTVAGNGEQETVAVAGPALASPLPVPSGLALLPDGTIVLVDMWMGALRISRPTPDPESWTLQLSAKGPSPLAQLDLCPPTTVRFNVMGLAARGDELYFTDVPRDVIWKATFADPDDPLTWKVTHLSGGPSSDEGALLADTAFDFWGVGPLAIDPAGKALYVGVGGELRVRQAVLDPADPRAGRVFTVAGDGQEVSSGDGGPALQASFASIHSLALDAASRLFVTSDYDDLVRFVTVADPAPLVDAAAGVGTGGYSGDGGPARAAQLLSPCGVAASAAHVFVADSGNAAVRAVPTSGAAASWAILTAAGDGTAGDSGDGGPASAARLGLPEPLSYDPFTDSVFVGDKDAGRVRRIALHGSADPAAWTMEAVSASGGRGGDGGPVGQASVPGPHAIASNGAGDVYVSEGGRVRRIHVGDPADPATWEIVTVLGEVDPAGDGPLAIGQLGAPTALAALDEQHWLVADGASGRVRLVDLAAGLVRSVAGYPDGRVDAPGERIPARFSRLLRDAGGIAYDPQTQSVYVSETSGHVLRRLAVGDLSRPYSWTIETFAGDPAQSTHVDGTLAQSRFYGPAGLAFDPASRTLYVAEPALHDVRAIAVDDPGSPTCVSTVAGLPGRAGSLDGTTDRAMLHGPRALAVGAGGLYIADTANHRVRWLDLAAKTLGTVLGDGTAASTGEGAPASAMPVDSPRGLALDPAGNLVVSSRDTLRLVVAGPSGQADAASAVRTIYGAPRTSFPMSVTRCLAGVALAAQGGQVLALDQCQGFLLRLTRGPR